MSRTTACALLLVLFALSLDAAQGQTASLARDINSAGPGRSSSPGTLYSVPGKLFLFGRGGENDSIWVSDGTPAGTTQLADTCPDDDCSSPDNQVLGKLGGTLLFMDIDSGTQLWRSDGTRPGTYLLTGPGTNLPFASISTRDPDERTHAFFRDAFYFMGCQDGFNVCSTWRTDGTVAGTVDMGFLASRPTPVGDRLFFVVFVDTYPHRYYELRVSDGTGAGTLLAKLDDFPRTITAAGNRLFFFSGGEVWASDGTPAGTLAVTAFQAGGPESEWLKPAGNRVYFLADDVVHGEEIWVSDGTLQGTRRVTEFGYVDPFSNYPGNLEEVNGRLVFIAWDGIHERGLWTSTGTPESTASLPSPETCSYCDFIQSPELVKAGGRLLFRGQDALHGAELWSTDGTPAGTRLVADVCPGPCGSLRYDAQVVPWPGGALLMGADDGSHGEEIWFSDGTAAGTRRLTDLADGSAFDSPYFDLPAAHGNEIYFSARIDFEQGSALWATGGDPSSTRMVARLSRSEPASNPAFPTALGDRLYFTAGDENTRGLWSTLGTPGSTVRTDPAESFGDEVKWTAAAGGLVYFWKHSYDTFGSIHRLWRTDGTAAGTFALAEDQNQKFQTPGVAFQGKLYIPTWDGLWASDGTVQGTSQVFAEPDDLHSLAAAGGALYFATDDAVWRSDGTAAGTLKLADVPGTTYSGVRFVASGPFVFFATAEQLWKTDGTPWATLELTRNGPKDLTAFQGGVAFFGHSPQGGRALWRSDGTAAGAVHVRHLPAFGSYGRETPSGLAVLGGKLFFTAWDQEHGAELWTSDGTAAGTVLLRDLAPGSAASYPRRLTAAGGRLFFAANDGVHGAELWVSDGTAAGTRMVQDLNPYAQSSTPDHLAVAGNRLYFTADDGLTGRELWSLDLAAGPGCQPSPTRLCLNGGRFQAEAFWKDFQGNRGAGQAVALTADTGYFWYFDPANVEAVVKVLDGRGLNGHFWAFYGALSSVEYHLTVTDTQTGAARRYYNPPGQLASVGDTQGFGPLGAFSRTGAAAPFQPTDERLCLNGGRFAVEISWKDFQGKTGKGKAVNLTPDTGWFWFFDPANVEVMLKVLDGTPLNGKHWVFYGALSSVEYTITVTDTRTGAQKTYKNPSGRLASVADTGAF